MILLKKGGLGTCLRRDDASTLMALYVYFYFRDELTTADSFFSFSLDYLILEVMPGISLVS